MEFSKLRRIDQIKTKNKKLLIALLTLRLEQGSQKSKHKVVEFFRGYNSKDAHLGRP
jgi:hypothetical protein